MIKKLKSTDFLLVIAIALIAMIHMHYISIIPFVDDESFYAVVPFRLINGDSLVRHEWHLSQFSAIFSYIPVYFWTAIKGSTEGIILFLRYIYLFLHTIIAFVIYFYFRKNGICAVLAAIMFYIQVAYKIFAISYPTMFAIFLLLFVLCLVSIYHKQSTKFYIFAGLCFGCCCINNPLFCFAFVIYLIACVFWAKHETIERKVKEIKISRCLKKGEKLTKRQKEVRMEQLPKLFPNAESYGCFFDKKAILRFVYGILIAATVALIFYFFTGGTIDALFANMENILSASEYTSQTFFKKLQETITDFNSIDTGLPWLLPVTLIMLLVDNKRREQKHRFIYLSLATLWAVLYVYGVILNDGAVFHAYSLPFGVFSFICYFLTNNKNKVLFRCVYIPCLVASVFQYLAANTHLAAIGIAFAISNVAGVFLVRDLFNEIRSDSKNNPKFINKISCGWQKSVIIAIVCIQLFFYILCFQWAQITITDDTTEQATIGPYSGLYMDYEQYDEYTKEIEDVTVIKEIVGKKDPVLLITYNNWQYLYLDRPIATYTTWYMGSVNIDLLRFFYKANPRRTPRYIYIISNATLKERIEILSEIFELELEEELSKGVLFAVKDCKF